MSNVEKTSEAQAKEDHLLQEHLDYIWDQYSITRNPTFLAAFVRLGGDISDEETRNLIADLLETAKFKHSRARPNANASFYLDVKELVSQHLIDDKEKDLSEAEAIRRIAEIEGISEKAGISRFHAGKKLAGGK